MWKKKQQSGIPRDINIGACEHLHTLADVVAEWLVEDSSDDDESGQVAARRGEAGSETAEGGSGGGEHVEGYQSPVEWLAKAQGEVHCVARS